MPCTPPPPPPPPRHALGFESLENEVRVDSLPLRAQLPAWLTGSLVRTGPAKWEVGERTMNHWFDGLAMLHRFGFGDGSVSYASRFLESSAYRAAQRDRARSPTRSSPPTPAGRCSSGCTSMFSPKLSDNANVNLVQLGERFIAMTETPIPVQFDAETLETAGVAYEVPGMLTTAHPHLDRATKRDAQLRRRARAAQRVPLLPPRPRRRASPR